MNRSILSEKVQDQALALVAAWLGPQMGYEGPAPTGREAANTGQGPQLIRDWDWPSAGETPSIILEGGPYDWAIEAGAQLLAAMNELGIHCEPYSGYALCLYPA